MRNLRILIFSAMIATAATAAALTPMEQRLIDKGYVDVTQAVPGIVVDLMYARTDNFTGRVLYDSLSHAYLHPDAARALSRAAKELDRLAPGCRFIVKDAARPVSVQKRMFNTVRGTAKARYVANPANGGGTHNFGIAVDITICDSLGRELSMGTPVDHLGPESNIDRESTLIRTGKLTRAEHANRLLLRRVMRAAGFKTIRKEWWHFELARRAEAKLRYKLIE